MKIKTSKAKFMTDSEEQATFPIAVSSLMSFSPRKRVTRRRSGKMPKQIKKMRKTAKKYETEDESQQSSSISESEVGQNDSENEVKEQSGLLRFLHEEQKGRDAQLELTQKFINTIRQKINK